MQEDHDSLLEHMPLEEIRTERIIGCDPPDDWSSSEPGEIEPDPPPVLTERSDGSGYSLLVHHRTVWSARSRGKLSLRALVVRSNVHIPVAHGTVQNCLEEALLFEGLLREQLVENRSRLADMLGYSRARITQVLNLLKLPEQMKSQLLLADEISEFQLRPLVRISDPEAQREAFRKLMADNLTGRQMEKYLSGRGSTAGRASVEKPAAGGPVSKSGSGQPDLERLMREDEAAAASGPVAAKTGKPAAGAPDAADGTGMLRRLIRENGPQLRREDWNDVTVFEGLPERDIVFLSGVALLQKGLYDKALDVLEGVIAASPEHALAYYYLGRCRNLLGDLDEAESSLRTAIDLSPDDPDMLTDLAIVLEKQKRYDEATSCYRSARRLRKRVSSAGGGGE